MADALRGSMDAAEYKHVVLGLIFLKYISDAFEERRAAIVAEFGEDAAEDRDEYTAESIFWVPRQARWRRLMDGARQPNIGQLVDDAMTAVERDNPALKDVLPLQLRSARVHQMPQAGPVDIAAGAGATRYATTACATVGDTPTGL